MTSADRIALAAWWDYIAAELAWETAWQRSAWRAWDREKGVVAAPADGLFMPLNEATDGLRAPTRP